MVEWNGVPMTPAEPINGHAAYTFEVPEGSTLVIFNNGTSYEALPPAQKGDLLFSDGTWGTLDRFPAKTPVGIVFSTDVSAADYTAGYTHGYAIALKDVNSSATMAWSTETVQIGTPVNLSSQALLDRYVASAT